MYVAVFPRGNCVKMTFQMVIYYLMTIILEYTSGEISDVPTCGEPAEPKNGSVSVWGDGYLIEYSCDEGLSPVGDTFGSCDTETGLWSVKKPLCVGRGCGKPEPLSHGRLYRRHGGAVLQVTCRRGYRLTGSRQRHCNGYKWIGLRPRCRAMYASRAGRRQAYDEANSTSSPEQTKADLLQEHVLDGDDTCYKRYSVPPKIDYGDSSVQYKYNSVKKMWVMFANYSCETGYKLADQFAGYLYCKQFKWQAGTATPTCVREETAEDNPCAVDNGGCEQLCVAKTGRNYQCKCRQGYSPTRYRKSCQDVDECELDSGGCDQLCVNTPGSYFCTCEQGYIISSHRCLDEDECQRPEGGPCPRQCENTVGGYECLCDNVTGYQQAPDKRSCVDQDECESDNGGCEDVCRNTVGSYTCACSGQGYILSQDGRACQDLNECTRYKSKLCRNGACMNTEGSYYCECDHGFELRPDDNRCIDVDECDRRMDGCEDTCINTVGSYECQCPGRILAPDLHACNDTMASDYP